jgi:hypothetical protein
MSGAIGAALVAGSVGLAVVLARGTDIALVRASVLAAMPLVLAAAGVVVRRRRGGRAAVAAGPASPRGLRRADLPSLLALLVLHVALLSPALGPGRGLMPVDSIRSFAPWKTAGSRAGANPLLSDQYLRLIPQRHFLHEQLRRGDLPLWNPHLSCGIPFLASMQQAALFPIHLLLVPLDAFAASTLAALIKLYLAGLFTYLYVRRLGPGRPAALLAATAFSLSGFMVVWLGHPQVNVGLWLPLLLYLVERQFATVRGDALPTPGESVRLWAGLALALGCMVLGGHPPTGIHVALCVVAYFACRLVASRKDARAWPRVAGFIGALVGGAVLAAPQLLPYAEYHRHSSVALASNAVERASRTLSPHTLVHYMLPYVAGSPVTGFEALRQQFPAPRTDNFNERTGYFGVIALCLALWAPLCGRDRHVRFHAALAAACLLVIYGAPPVPRILAAVPLLRDINHARLLLVVGLAGAVLGAFGLDRLSTIPRRRRLVLLAGAWLASGVTLAWVLFRLRASLDGQPEVRWFVARQAAVLVAGLVIVSAITLGAERRRLAAGLALGGIGFEMLWFAWGYNPASDRSDYYPPAPSIRFLQQDPGRFRIVGLGPVLPPNTAMVFGLDDVRGQDFTTVRRYEELVTGDAGSFWFLGKLDHLPAATLVLGVKYVLTPPEILLAGDLAERVYRDEQLAIHRLRGSVERAFVVRRHEALGDPRSVLERMVRVPFDVRRDLLLEQSGPPLAELPRSAAPPGEDRVSIVAYSADEVRLDVGLREPGFLVLLDTYFPGWVAEVDGTRVPILRADYNFRAVHLPAGTWRVRFSYRPLSFAVGLTVGVGSAAWLLALVVGSPGGGLIRGSSRTAARRRTPAA